VERATVRRALPDTRPAAKARRSRSPAEALRGIAHAVGNRNTARLLRQTPPAGGGGGGGGGGIPKRTIVLDGNVFHEINRGNKDYAERLKSLVQTEDVYISHAAYQQVVVDPPMRRHATANKLIVDELHIKITPPARADVLSDIRARNAANRNPLSANDLLVAADAKSFNGEVLSPDTAFRNNANGVRTAIGVRVATDSETLPIAPHGSVQDYRVGRRLLGLEPVEISFDGTVTRPPKPGPTGGGSGGGSSGGGTGTGPSTGARVTAGVVILVLGFSKLFNWKIDHDNEERIKERAAQLEPQIKEMRDKDPHMGQLLVYRFKGAVEGHEGAVADARFEGISVVEAHSEAEAHEVWARQRGYDASDTYDFQWLDPVDPLFEAPWPAYGLGKFADISRIRFQNVQFKEWGGFDTDGQSSTLDATSMPQQATAYRFQILQMPAKVSFLNINQYPDTKSVDLAERVVAGGTVPVVMLDGQPAVAVMPADAQTEELFKATKPINDWRRLRLIPNVYRVRWLRPEQVELIPTEAQAKAEAQRVAKEREAARRRQQEELERQRAEEEEERRREQEPVGMGAGSRSG
jgi:predicted nucleic acid-binding protein